MCHSFLLFFFLSLQFLGVLVDLVMNKRRLFLLSVACAALLLVMWLCSGDPIDVVPTALATTSPIFYAENSSLPPAGSVFSSEVGTTLQLLQTQNGKLRGDCPKRYLFANTHTFGRHHNQLQEIMNVIMWARRLNRTAVLGWFRWSHRWVDPSVLYDFSKISSEYCVISAETLRVQLPREERSNGLCFGQGVDDTPLRHALKCRMAPDVPAHYNARFGAETTKAHFFPKVVKAKETFVGLSGEIAFFMRVGLEAAAAIYGLLRPSAAVQKELAAFTQSAFQGDRSYFALHLRMRERDCLVELRHAFTVVGASLSSSERRVLETQCSVTVQYVRDTMKSVGVTLGGAKFFLASDHQNATLEKALVEAGAVVYKGSGTASGALTDLAVDFFAMVQAKFFTGNQLSSISQNACFVRLGRGSACHGVVESFAREQSRDIAT